MLAEGFRKRGGKGELGIGNVSVGYIQQSKEFGDV